MGTNEDYLDNLLQSMLAEESGANGSAQTSLIDDSGANDSQKSDEMDLDALLNSLEGIDEETDESGAVSENEPEEDIFSTGEESAEPKEWQEAEQAEEEYAAEPEESADSLSGEAKMLSPEEIEAMFAQMDEEEAQESENQLEEIDSADEEIEATSGESVSEEDDLLAMLENMEEENPELDEINTLLEKSDNNEFVNDDMMALQEDTADEGAGMDADILNGEGDWESTREAEDESTKAGKGRRQKRERKKKEKTEKVKKEKVKKEKEPGSKGGFFSVLLNYLTEDTPDEEEVSPKSAAAEGSEEADGEKGGTRKKGKKPKKEKVKKEKAEKEKKPKKEKKKKEKVKKEKPPKEPEAKGKPLPKKKLMTVILFAATVFVAVMLFTDFIPGIVEVTKAKEAFKEADYGTVYGLLAGKEKKAEEEEIYQAALLVEQMQRSADSYLNYERLGMDMQALDALVKGVGKYRSVSEKAGELGVQAKVDELYEMIRTTLWDVYGVSEEEALEMLAAEDDVYYTLGLKKVLGYETVKVSEAESLEEESGVDTAAEPDVLEEEQDIISQ